MSKQDERLSEIEKVGYSLGDLAANLIFQTLITYLAFFYTDVYRLPPTAAASIIFIVGLLGAFVFTPLIGLLAWSGIYLRDQRLWKLVPIRRKDVQCHERSLQRLE